MVKKGQSYKGCENSSRFCLEEKLCILEHAENKLQSKKTPKNNKQKKKNTKKNKQKNKKKTNK